MDKKNWMFLILITAVCVTVVVLVWTGREASDVLTSEPTKEKIAADTADTPKESQKESPSDKAADDTKADEAKDANGKKGQNKDAASPSKDSKDKQAKEEPEKKKDDASEKKESSESDGDEEDGMEALNIKDMEVQELIAKLADWTGKVVIPHEEALKQKITIYSPKELPRTQALSLIYSALQSKGYIVEQTDEVIYLKPIKEARLALVPTIAAEESLALLADKSRIVQKFFRLDNQRPADLQQVILPMVAEYGYVTADENTNTLIIIETVANLQRIEGVIRQLDIPEAEKTVTRIFEIHHGDPAEIVQLLKLLLHSEVDKGRKGGPDKAPAGKDSTPAGSTVIQMADAELVLIPEQHRNWIISRASAEMMRQVEQWIERLDQPRPEASDYEIVRVQYADVREVADRLKDTLEKMPGSQIKASVMVQPLVQERQIMIFGDPEKRVMVKKLILEIDIPSDKFETQVFDLKYADADQIKENIESMFEERAVQARYIYRYYSRGVTSDMVRAIAFPALKQVTVIASPENMVKVAKQIAEWDVPIDVSTVKPMIIELRNSDPVKMADLLSNLFTEKVSTQRRPWWMWDDESDDKKKIVGALYGKLTFEAVPETRKIIVISQIPEGYKVVEELIVDLDRQIAAELPMVVMLKYADPEDLCERLNALLNETGTLATIHLSKRELSSYASGATSEQEENNNNSESGQTQTLTTEYKPWWTTATARRGMDEVRPISNVIGKIRFIPDYRSKAVLVLAPAEYMDSVRQMINDLDKPAKQVLVKAVILSVDHESMTSLGVQLSSNPEAFGAISENALEVFNELQYGESFMSLRLDSSLDVNLLIDMLVKKADAQVLNQPSIWAKDNEEATFFNGRTIPFITESKSSPEANSFTQSFEKSEVGLTLRIRPNITPEKAVDLTVNLILSQLEEELILGNTATQETNTTTHMIVDDDQTILISGILFQKNVDIQRKVPLLGDLPLLGGVFRHSDQSLINQELMIFITPQVVDDNTRVETERELQQVVEKMRIITEKLNADVQKNLYDDPNYYGD